MTFKFFPRLLGYSSPLSWHAWLYQTWLGNEQLRSAVGSPLPVGKSLTGKWS